MLCGEKEEENMFIRKSYLNEVKAFMTGCVAFFNGCFQLVLHYDNIQHIFTSKKKNENI